MKFIWKLFKHKIIIGVCLLVASITALTAILVPAYTRDMKSDDDSHMSVATDPVSEVSEVEPKEANEIAPNHDYSSVIASMNSGAKIYVGVTTASDLKNNLNVTGTFTSGDASVTVNLKKSEYTLQVSIGSFVKDLSENDVILDSLPGDSEQVNLIVKVRRNSGEITSSFAVPVASIVEGEDFEAFEAVTSITVENVASITNDYDKEALKNILVVKDNTGKVIQNKELYDVTFLSNLVPGSGATFQVTYKAGDTTLPSVSGTIGNVTQAQILAADFSVNPNYHLDGMYYKKQSTEAGESDKWFSAFVAGSAGIAGSTIEDIYGDGLKLTVHYPNSSRTLSFSSFGENSSTADTNEYVVFNTTSFVENANDITASVYNYIGGQSVNASISINFELAKIVEIKADGYNKNLAGLVSSGLPDTTFFMQDMDKNISYVKTRANTGVWSENYLTISGFSVDGTLTPTADVIAQAATMTSEQLASFKYKKDVTIIYNEDESITTTYQVDVLYEAPTSVYRVNVKNNKFPNQTMRTPFNFGDLYVVLQYGEDSDIDIEVPLTEFLDANGNSDHIRIELYSDTGRTQPIGTYTGETPIITKEVQGIRVSFRYDVNGAWCIRSATGSRPGMSVAKYVVSLPTFDTRTISFSTNSTKSIIFNGSIEQEILNGLE
ncbi:MAG: hypothetical protein K2N42_05235, partial [Anaeroplasmataceae bacterium]|nr:hypothetical protein [Anaeroplasmataceae bacterium]